MEDDIVVFLFRVFLDSRILEGLVRFMEGSKCGRIKI